MLVTAFRSPAPIALFLSLRPGVNVPGLLLRFLPYDRSLPVRIHTPRPSPVCSRPRPLLRMNPVAAPAHGMSSCFSGLPTLRGFYPPPDRKQTGLAATRPACRNRPMLLRSPPLSRFQSQLRITVPESLRLRRLAVPQTSWNLLHYAPESVRRQSFSGLGKDFSTTFKSLDFQYDASKRRWKSCVKIKIAEICSI